MSYRHVESREKISRRDQLGSPRTHNPTTHLVIDLFGARRVDDVAHIEATLKRCVEATGGELLDMHLHHAAPSGGISAMAVLPDGHLSIRCWAQTGYAAVDVLMDSEGKARLCLDLIKAALETGTVTVRSHRRGGSVGVEAPAALPVGSQRQRTRVRRVA